MKAWLVTTACLAGPVLAMEGTAREWRFDVSLDGRPIGEHTFSLRESAGARELTSEARFRVRILFLNAYHYDHRARELWRGDCLERLDASTDSNGKVTDVALAGPAVQALGDCVKTFAYWNPGILGATRLLNPQTGEYVSVVVTSLGRELIGGQPADRYRLQGGGRTPLEIDLWYSPARDWVALESRTPEGRRLRYSRK